LDKLFSIYYIYHYYIEIDYVEKYYKKKEEEHKKAVESMAFASLNAYVRKK